MENKPYELIEHTADVGIRVKGADLKDLFKNAAIAMFDIVAARKTEANPPKKIIVKQSADNLEELFINWLNELLYLSATKDLIFSDLQIARLNEKGIEAIAAGSDMKNYKMNTEIKAATYHQLKLKQIESGWQAEVIFDV